MKNGNRRDVAARSRESPTSTLKGVSDLRVRVICLSDDLTAPDQLIREIAMPDEGTVWLGNDATFNIGTEEIMGRRKLVERDRTGQLFLYFREGDQGWVSENARPISTIRRALASARKLEQCIEAGQMTPFGLRLPITNHACGRVCVEDVVIEFSPAAVVTSHATPVSTPAPSPIPPVIVDTSPLRIPRVWDALLDRLLGL